MIELCSDALSVSVLDPVADAGRLGTRYCTGGFIFQIQERAERPAEQEGKGCAPTGNPAPGALLAGPTFPDSYNLFDGQGIPDAFQPHLPVEHNAGGAGARTGDGNPTRVLGIGIGLIDVKANAVVERCVWDIRRGDGTLAFRTTQDAGGYRFELERSLTLGGRTLRSATVLSNTGDRHVPFQWYPHPFFPLYPTGECCRLSVPVNLPENPGYELLDNGFLRMKHLPWTGSENHFQILGHPGNAPVSFVQKHPVTSLVTAACDYVPTRIPVWGNRFTVSFEPYYERQLSPGDTARWSVTYDF